MLVDLKVDGKCIVLVGGGSEGYRKTCDFVEAGAKVLVVSLDFSEGIKSLSKAGKICLQKEKIVDAHEFVNSFDPKPYLLAAVTNDHELNAALIEAAKAAGCMVYAPDNPATSDFILPAVAKVGDVRIAVSTSGKSPAMASMLRRRIEKLITPEDMLQIKLQSYLRQALKDRIPDQKVRRQQLYRIIEDALVQGLLKEGKYEKAKKTAERILGKT
jgi:precorrin-2 dehydrogenase / sirohydrochlorin ferrochelatase